MDRIGNHMNNTSRVTRNDEPLYTIGVAARLTGTTVHALRMYEEKGLLRPYKSDSGRRLYSNTDIIRLRCVRRHLDQEGLNIAGIKALLALVTCWLIKPCPVADRHNTATPSYPPPSLAGRPPEKVPPAGTRTAANARCTSWWTAAAM